MLELRMGLWRCFSGGLVLALVLAVAVLSSCTKKKSADLSLDTKETLRLHILTEPPSLDWSISTDTTSSLMTSNIMEGLVDYDFNSGKPVLQPALAIEWKANPDFSEWTFKLRQGVKWTDGVEFKAQHVAEAWQRLLAPETASSYAYFLFNIKNSKDFNAGKIKNFSEVGVQAVNDYELKVTLEQSQVFFPKILAHHSTYPQRVDVVKKFQDQWTEPQNIVTLGAYKLKAWEHDKSITLVRNDTYYDTPAKVKNIHFYMADLSTAVNMFDSGGIDALNSVPSVDIAQHRKRPEFREGPILSLYYIGFNTQKAPFDNVNVRKAMNMALNKKQITDMLAGGQKPISGFLPQGMRGYSDDIGLKFNLARALELLKEAGFGHGQLPTIELSYNTNENHKRIAENIQAQLKKNLGLDVRLKNSEWKVYLASLQSDSDKAHLFRLGWLGDYPDPDTFLSLLTGDSDNNHTGWKNPDYDALVKQALSEGDEAKRVQLYQRAQRILTEQDAPIIPIYSNVAHYLVHKRVKNYPINSLAMMPFKNVELE